MHTMALSNSNRQLQQTLRLVFHHVYDCNYDTVWFPNNYISKKEMSFKNLLVNPNNYTSKRKFRSIAY